MFGRTETGFGEGVSDCAPICDINVPSSGSASDITSDTTELDSVETDGLGVGDADWEPWLVMSESGAEVSSLAQKLSDDT